VPQIWGAAHLISDLKGLFQFLLSVICVNVLVDIKHASCREACKLERVNLVTRDWPSPLYLIYTIPKAAGDCLLADSVL
jgi:hypothetical protein